MTKTPLWFWYEDVGPLPTPVSWSYFRNQAEVGRILRAAAKRLNVPVIDILLEDIDVCDLRGTP